jgi:hypothetical protein
LIEIIFTGCDAFGAYWTQFSLIKVEELFVFVATSPDLASGQAEEAQIWQFVWQYCLAPNCRGERLVQLIISVGTLKNINFRS